MNILKHCNNSAVKHDPIEKKRKPITNSEKKKFRDNPEVEGKKESNCSKNCCLLHLFPGLWVYGGFVCKLQSRAHTLFKQSSNNTECHDMFWERFSNICVKYRARLQLWYETWAMKKNIEVILESVT